MGQIIALIILAVLGYLYYAGAIDTEKMKENAIEAMKKEKTIQTVTQKRNQDQQRIYDVNNR